MRHFAISTVLAGLTLLALACETESDSGAHTGDNSTDSKTTAGGDTDPARSNDWLNEHNVIRQRVNDGAVPDQPAASPPLDVFTWDKALALVAQAYAEQCVTGHNNNRDKNYADLGGGDPVGENIWWIYSTSATIAPAEVVGDWYAEYNDYAYAPLTEDNFKGIGHYTQLVWRSTERVGCGTAVCGDFTIVVCDYAPAGNILTQSPY